MAESKPRPIGETQMRVLKGLMIPFSRLNARRCEPRARGVGE